MTVVKSIFAFARDIAGTPFDALFLFLPFSLPFLSLFLSRSLSFFAFFERHVVRERREIPSRHLDYRRRIYTDFRGVADDRTCFFFARPTESASRATTKRGPIDILQKDALSISPDIGREGETRRTRGEKTAGASMLRERHKLLLRHSQGREGVTQKVRRSRILPANPCRASENLGVHRANENVQKGLESRREIRI